MDRPRVFIGSSTEGLAIAENLQLGLDQQAECTIWHQGAFGLSTTPLENLSRVVGESDFAILVLTPDDLVHKRGEAQNSPRDNVIFELGLFMGALGRERTYIVCCRDDRIELPTDLAGVTVAQYGRRKDGNLQAAVGPVCTQIKAAIQKIRNRQELHPATSSDEAVSTLSAELKALRLEFSAQTEHVRRVMESLISGSHARDVRDQALHSLEGKWKDLEVGTTAFARVIGGQLRVAYCFGSDDHLTGEYYNWREFDEALIARFRWINGRITGYGYFERKGPDRLEGGWWLSRDVPEERVTQLPRVEGMVPVTWIRQRDASEAPLWAEAFFDSIKANLKSGA